MNSREKKRFIRDLTKSVRDSVLDKVDRMPENWDGIELRHYIADRFEAQAMTYGRGPGSVERRRYRDYKNDVIVHNL